MNEPASQQPIPSILATAGVGYGFEHKIQAYYLLQLIAGDPTAAGRIVRLQFQARYEGVRTDDLICTYATTTHTSRVFIQCKSSVKARKSDPGFSTTLLDAWMDFSAALSNPDFAFKIDFDYLALIYNLDDASENMRVVGRLIQLAKNSNSAADYSKKCHAKHHRDLLRTIYDIVQPDDPRPPAEALWAFFRVLKWSSFCFEGNLPVHHNEVLKAIADRTGNPESADLIWLGLIQAAATLNGSGATIDRSNLADLIAPVLLSPLTQSVRPIGGTPVLPNFPWGAPLWSVQIVRMYAQYGGNWNALSAADLLLYLRALRTTQWLSGGLSASNDFGTLAYQIACNLDMLHGTFDDRSALATFLMLNLTDAYAQRELVQWSVRCAAGPFRLNTSEVELVLRRLYLHYHGVDASDAPRLADRVEQGRGREISRLRYGVTALWISSWAARMFDDDSPDEPEPSQDQFKRMCWAISDTYPDYRRPEHDTSAWLGTAGVVSFQALMRAVRSGSVGEVLSNYSLCTSEPTFERLLNAHAELSAHVRNRVPYISANDEYILHEMEKLLQNTIADHTLGYVQNKLVVLPIQGQFPLLNEEVINLPFMNFSLAPGFVEAAREEHESLVGENAETSDFAHSWKLWSFETIFADVMLAMTLKTKMFANSRSEAAMANTHGVGVSQLNMNVVFHE